MLKFGKIGCSALSVSFSPLSLIFTEIWAVFHFSSNSNMAIVANRYIQIADRLIGVTHGLAAMLMLFVWPWRCKYYVQHMETSLKSSFVGTSPRLMGKHTSVCPLSLYPSTNSHLHTHPCLRGTTNWDVKQVPDKWDPVFPTIASPHDFAGNFCIYNT